MHRFFGARQNQISLLCIAAVFAVQSAFSLVYCHQSLWALWPVTAACVALSAVFLLAGRPNAATAGALTLLPFLIWANYQECVKPYAGGGAAMAYVVVFLYGVPASLVAAFLFARHRRQPESP
jgi:hypothetical protein